MSSPFFHLKGRTLVLIDWANMFHAQAHGEWTIDTKKLFSFLRLHKSIHDIVFFHGTDEHPKSINFLNEQASIGYRVVTKAVKKMLVSTDHEGKILFKSFLRRKCDFDVEITIEILLNLGNYQSFMLFSGDGDYASVFDVLRKLGKKAILVFPKGRLGRGYLENELRRKSIFLCSLERLRPFIEATVRPGSS